MPQGTIDFETVNAKPVRPCDPNADAADGPRLTGQNAAILKRLRAGPATNAELAEISMKYTGRISDIRAAGIPVKSAKVAGGVWRYWLDGEPGVAS